MTNKIKVFEGFRRKPYLCPAGYWTVGYGHMLGAGRKGATLAQEIKQRGGLSDSEVESVFAADLMVSERAVTRLIKRPLKQHQLDALTSFTFNLGAGALERSTLRMRVNRGESAPMVRKEFLRWVHSNGKVLVGLVIRRQFEADYYAGLIVTMEPVPVPVPRPAPRQESSKPPQSSSVWRRILDAFIGGLRKER